MSGEAGTTDRRGDARPTGSAAVSYWDGAILAAAEALEAPVLYTEDLNHGRVYGRVRAVNPFVEA